MAGRGIKQAENDDGHVFRRNRKLTLDQDEIRKLKGHLKRDSVTGKNTTKSIY